MEQLPGLAAVLVKSCQGADIAEGSSWYLSAWLWLRYALFSYCPQHLLVSAVHLLFVLGVLALSVYKAARSRGRANISGQEQRNGRDNGGKETRWKVRTSTVFTATLYTIGVVAVVYLAVAVWRLWLGLWTEDEVPVHELIFAFSLALAWLTFGAVVGHEKKFRATTHSPLLRAWWVVNFVIGLLLLVTSIQRFIAGGPHFTQLWVDNVLGLATFPVVAFLFVVACVGTTGVWLEEADSELQEALLTDKFGDEDVTEFASAGLFSKLTWAWVNPLLARGKVRPLVASDIPQLAPDDRAEVLYERLRAGFDTGNGPRSVGVALVHTFWPTLAFTAFLCLVKLSVMYIGPLLITQFTAYAAGEQLFPHEGLVLVVILFAAKVIESLSSHHYNFWSQKLGMTVRSSLITTVYRKGLRLSSHARQAHGVGQIVNYMSVDVQQISDSVVQLHNVWLLPLQTAAALVILYTVIGVACFGGIAVMVFILVVSFSFASLQRMYQGKIMSAKDHRMSVTSEVLNSMKIIKLQAWEDKFKSKVEGVRDEERSWITKFMYALSVNIFFLWLSPLAVSTATFALCVVLGTELTSSKVFTALSTFRIMQEPLRLFPQALMSISQALNSVDRLQRYMVSDELDQDAVERGPVYGSSKYAVEVEGGVFKWLPEAEKPTLTHINLHIEHGSFVAIVGQVGSGKSALLMALLGEVPKLAGTVKLNGRTGYVAQSAWIQNATIQDNILFGKPLDRAKYQETVRVCSLQTDLAQMTYGDQTEIGERGINLSGGQKQRIQLARAVYQDADIYFLDDVFSAVDATTGSELFQHCVRGALSGKTILLVTHQVDFLPEADLILVMRDGEVVQSGKYASLLDAGTDFSALVAAHNEAMELVAAGDEWEEGEEPEKVDTAMDELDKQPLLGESPSTFARSVTLERQGSSKRGPEKLPSRKLIRSDSKSASRKGKSKLISEEERATGQVGLAVYWLYGTKALKGLHVIALLIFQSCWQGLQIASDYFLAEQTADENQASFDSTYFITRYSELAFGSGFFVLLRSVTVAFAGLLTAQSFFVSLVNSIFLAPMSFFDTTPTGRILSRFTTDQTNVDILIPLLAGTVLGQGFQALGIIVVVVQVTWQMLIIVIPVGWAYFWYQRHFITSSREITRVDALTKSPVINHFSETISGFTTIRAFQQQERFAAVNVDRVNANLRMDFHNNAATEWLGYRLEFLGSVVLATSALFMVTVGLGYIDSGKVGLSLSYGLALNGCMYGVVYIACQLENKMVSVERIDQYCRIPREAPAIVEGHRPAEGWPPRGAISLKNLHLRYRPDTPLVLKGINLNIQGGQKVGVVGRTGSGKSTLILAIFRLVEPDNGSVVIDDLDISTIGLKDLRSKFSIIPQDPTLFEGTVRSNIDPLGEHNDPEIWEALEKCQLAPTVREKDEKLDTVVLENGDNFSVGQRQLFALGRAILKHSKILVLDEATASVDSQTDAIIQRTIKEEFADSTVISIAHRIPTVMDSDKVLVLDAGLLKEFDSPSKLLENHHSLFSSLVREYTVRSASSTNMAALDQS